MSVTGFFHAGVTVSDMETRCASTATASGSRCFYDGPASGRTAARIWASSPARCGSCSCACRARTRSWSCSSSAASSATARRRGRCDYGAGHFCLFIDDAEALHARMTRGLGFRSRAGEVVTIHSGPARRRKAVYLIDPDGYHVELYERP